MSTPYRDIDASPEKGIGDVQPQGMDEFGPEQGGGGDGEVFKTAVIHSFGSTGTIYSKSK